MEMKASLISMIVLFLFNGDCSDRRFCFLNGIGVNQATAIGIYLFVGSSMREIEGKNTDGKGKISVRCENSYGMDWMLKEKIYEIPE